MAPQTEFPFVSCKVLMRIDEVCETLRLSAQQVRDLVSAGRLKAKYIGDSNDPIRRHVRVFTASVQEFLATEIEKGDR